MVDSIFLSKFFDGKIVDVVSDVGLDRISYKCDNDTIYSFVKKNRLLELMKDKLAINDYAIQTVRHFNRKRWEAKLFSRDEMNKDELIKWYEKLGFRKKYSGNFRCQCTHCYYIK